MKRPLEMNEHSENITRSRPRLKLENAPPVNSLKDLIELGKSIKFFKNLDTIMLWRITPYLEELDNMVGMQELKESLLDQVLYYIQNLHSRNRNEEYLHTLIYGPPGTGKTTVAKIIAKLYQSMGVLSPSGPFKIAHRDDFVAGYLGQTAIKTSKLLKSCIGGVLFIDEVYSLGPKDSDKDSFSDEAIDTLVSFLSEHKNDFCCIAAGYESDIEKRLMSKNEGLRRRFQWVHRITEYSPENLADIFIGMVSSIKWQLAPEKRQIAAIISNNKDVFSFAGGDMEALLTKAKMAHSKRVFSLGKDHKFVLTVNDIEEGIKSMKKHKKPEKVSDVPLSMYT